MQDEKQEGRTQVYELGYHIVPSVSGNDLPQEVAAIKDLIEKNGGVVVSEEAPKSRPLSYTIFKVVAGVKQKCDSAYFGWIKFEGNSESIRAVKEGVDTNPHILRYLLIKTVKESTLYGAKLAQAAKAPAAAEAKKDKPEGAAAEKPAMSPEDIDKTIDDMVKE